MKIDKHTKQSIVRAIMNDVPKPDYKKRRADLQAAVVKLMSPEVRRVFKLCPGALHTYHVGETLYDGQSWWSRTIVCGDVPSEKIDELVAPYQDEDRACRHAQANLTNIVNSCNTLAALKRNLPEFESYFPTEAQPTKNLPALANVVADLSKLGWPKGQQTKEK